MNSYLKVCGIILNILVAVTIVGIIISALSERRYLKKIAAENAKTEAAYKEELELAEQAWQQWAKKLDELTQNYEKEFDLAKRLRAELNILVHRFQSYYRFDSIGKKVLLETLGEDKGWTLQKEISLLN